MPVYRYQFSGAPDSLDILGQYLPAIPTAAATGPALIVDVTVAAIAKADLDDVMGRRGYTFLVQDPLNSAADESAGLTLSRLTLSNAGVPVGKRAGVNLTGSAAFSDDPLNDRVGFNAAAVGAIAGWNPTTIPTPGTSDVASRADHTHRAEVVQSTMFDLGVNATTTSTTFALLSNGSVVVQAGSALLIYVSGAISNSVANVNMNARLIVDGVVFRGCSMRSPAVNVSTPFGFVFRVTGLVAGSHTVTVQWKTASGTAQCRPAAVPDSEHCTIVVQEVRA